MKSFKASSGHNLAFLVFEFANFYFPRFKFVCFQIKLHFSFTLKGINILCWYPLLGNYTKDKQYFLHSAFAFIIRWDFIRFHYCKPAIVNIHSTFTPGPNIPFEMTRAARTSEEAPHEKRCLFRNWHLSRG